MDGTVGCLTGYIVLALHLILYETEEMVVCRGCAWNVGWMGEKFPAFSLIPVHLQMISVGLCTVVLLYFLLRTFVT